MIFDDLVAGDRICQHLANTRVPTPLAGTYRAWLWVDGIAGDFSPDTRFNKVPVPYMLVGMPAATVASSYADLVDGSNLDNAIDRNETGTGIAIASRVWTNPTQARSPASVADCNEWTFVSPASASITGPTSSTTSTWTLDDLFPVNPACDSSSQRLYCFQQ